MESRPRVVLGTIGHDAHIVGSSVLRYALEGAGLEPVFLGALVQPQEFIDAAKNGRFRDLGLLALRHGPHRLRRLSREVHRGRHG